MKLTKFLQQGGSVDPNQAQQAPQGQEQGQGGNAQEQIIAMSQQIVQELGPENAAMLAQAIMQILQQGQQPQASPSFQRKGGKLVRI